MSYSSINQALYWATSEWSAQEIEEAHRKFTLSYPGVQLKTIFTDVANKLGLVGPIAEQCEHKSVIHYMF